MPEQSSLSHMHRLHNGHRAALHSLQITLLHVAQTPPMFSRIRLHDAHVPVSARSMLTLAVDSSSMLARERRTFTGSPRNTWPATDVADRLRRLSISTA
jgi:hypothetical protein